MKKILLFFCIILSSTIYVNGQIMMVEPGSFVAPLQGETKLVANFGELRTNHFHSGIDYSTGGIEGKNVLAAADGQVVRILISSKGNGKCLYLNHPNGYTTVYAHLQKFNTEIENYIRKIQYEKELSELDYFPKAGELKVSKGQVIALSGNTGGSSGPHLHFEIRNTKTEEVQNPEFFGLKILDEIAPEFRKIAIYDLNNFASTLVSVTNFGRTQQNDTLLTPTGNIGIGLYGVDYYTNRLNTFGIYSIILESDSREIYRKRMDSFSFENSKYINTHCDYSYSKQNKSQLEKCFIDGINKAPIYPKLLNDGKITIAANEVKHITIRIADATGNTSVINFFIKGFEPLNVRLNERTKPDSSHYFILPGVDNTINFANSRVNFIPQSLYDTAFLEILELPERLGMSNMLKVADENIPLHKSISISMRADSVQQNLTEKVCLIKKDGGYVGGTFSKGWLTASTGSLGTFYIDIDTIAPQIEQLNIPYNGKIEGLEVIKFRIRDNLSGIRKYDLYNDGEWLLTYYDAKNNLLVYKPDSQLTPGKHTFELIVVDNKSNSTKLSMVVIK